MSEMSPDQKQEKIKEIRGKLFTPEVVERLEGVDRMIEQEKEKESDYYAREQAISNDPNLEDDEKQKKLFELQKEVFGDDAEAFRRRENIRKGSNADN